MSAPTTNLATSNSESNAAALNRTTESPLVRYTLITIALGFLCLFIVLPTLNVFAQAFAKGPAAYAHTLFPPKFDPPKDATPSEIRQLKRENNRLVSSAQQNWHSINLTLRIAAVVVPLNVLFGVAAAWAITKFRFKGRTLLLSLIDLPFSVSPVVAGLIFVLLFGREGLWGKWATNLTWPDPSSLHWIGFTQGWWPFEFSEHFQGIIFTPLAITLASIFVTFPFVARALVPLMEAQGSDEELAAISLGATGFQAFRRVTLPNIKWGLLYGIVLCTARALGEFGAVSVVSGHLDSNATLPLRIEHLFQGYNNQAAFTLASFLTFLALLTLALKTWVEYKTRQERIK